MFVEDFKEYFFVKMGLLKLAEPYEFIKFKQQLQQSNCLLDLTKISVAKLMNSFRELGYNYAGKELQEKYLNVSVRGNRIINRFAVTVLETK